MILALIRRAAMIVEHVLSLISAEQWPLIRPLWHAVIDASLRARSVGCTGCIGRLEGALV